MADLVFGQGYGAWAIVHDELGRLTFEGRGKYVITEIPDYPTTTFDVRHSTTAVEAFDLDEGIWWSRR